MGDAPVFSCSCRDGDRGRGMDVDAWRAVPGEDSLCSPGAEPCPPWRRYLRRTTFGLRWEFTSCSVAPPAHGLLTFLLR
jgi:hypothetical protein